MLKYAHENGCPWDKYTCSDAAYHGHLNCLKYAHENGCPWDKNTCKNAVYTRSLDCLIYAHKNGCPCDLNCNSTTWCEYRCDICWEKKCTKHKTKKIFRKLARKYNNYSLYKDVIDVICSFI